MLCRRVAVIYSYLALPLYAFYVELSSGTEFVCFYYFFYYYSIIFYFKFLFIYLFIFFLLLFFFCISSDNALYFYQFSKENLIGFQSYTMIILHLQRDIILEKNENRVTVLSLCTYCDHALYL